MAKVIKTTKSKLWLVSDRITYDRSWVVEAASEEEAIDKANNDGPPADKDPYGFTYREEQDGDEASPYDAREVVSVERAGVDEGHIITFTDGTHEGR